MSTLPKHLSRGAVQVASRRQDALAVGLARTAAETGYRTPADRYSDGRTAGSVPSEQIGI